MSLSRLKTLHQDFLSFFCRLRVSSNCSNSSFVSVKIFAISFNSSTSDLLKSSFFFSSSNSLLICVNSLAVISQFAKAF